MRFTTIFTAFIASAAAAPAFDLVERACAVPVSGGLKGPFKLQAGGESELAGRYATAPSLPYVVFGVKDLNGSKDRTANFYLDGAGHLRIVKDGKTLYAYDNDVGAVTGHIALSANPNVGNKIVCKQGSSCNLNCSIQGYSTNCLSSPKYQPDWRIGGPAADDKPGCLPFQPKIVVV